MRTPLLTALLALALAANAADKRETRAVSGFTGLGMAAPIHVELKQGDVESLVVQGEESALAELETLVQNGSLLVRQRSPAHVRHMGKVKAFLTMKDIRAIAVSGSGDVIAASALRTADLKLAVSGSGDLRIADLTAKAIEAAVAGSGDLRMAGRADSIAAAVAGSGDLKASRLEARDVKVTVAGSGSASVWAKASLDAAVVGSGDVRYFGDPAVRKTTVRGSGSLQRMGPDPS